MQLSSIGWSPALQGELDALRRERSDADLQPARVVAEHRGAYEVLGETGHCWAEPTGKLRHEAPDALALPAVGDWVARGRAGRIEAVLPRGSAFVRKAAGPRTAPQVIAANIDRVFIVTSANADFNPRRIERYLTAVAESGAAPVIVINKCDLEHDPAAFIGSLAASAAGVPLASVSALERRGGESLAPFLVGAATIALVGSSGVGKSTLVNWLLERDEQDTAPIREHDARGRHTTTRRELLALPGGGALIDTPGMRELGLWTEDGALLGSFPDIEELARRCRFADCQHHGQPGCAIQAAVSAGQLDATRLDHYAKLQRELHHLQQRGTFAERRAHQRVGRMRAKALRHPKRSGALD